jgi:membrane protein required for beta-lactamase induction
MTLLATVMTEAAKHPTWLPPVAFPIIAAVVFLALGVMTWTYRDVANRHAHKAASTHHDDHEHGSAGHQQH